MSEVAPPRILFCGSRFWTDREAIGGVLKVLPKGSVIIEGAAPGADTIACEESRRLGFTIEHFPANWKRYGRAAGPIRNSQMLKEGKPDVVLAFHENIEASKGTKDMLKQAQKAGLPTFLNLTSDTMHEFGQWYSARRMTKISEMAPLQLLGRITKDSKPGLELSPELREWIRKDAEKRLKKSRVTLDKLLGRSKG